VGGAPQLGLVFAVVLAIGVALSGSLRATLRVFLGKHFFRYRFDYREEWLKFTATLSSQDHPQEAGKNVIRGLADMLESPAGGLWLLRPRRRSVPPGRALEFARRYRNRGQGWRSARVHAFDCLGGQPEEWRAYPGRYQHLRVPGWLAEYPQAWLLVPLWHGKDLLFVLASPRTPVEVNWEVIDLLKTAGRQAASILAQMQATEALLESRKFEAFSRMSAFVVHDPEKYRGPTVIDGQKRQAVAEQPGVSGRHADDRGKFAGTHAPADAATARRPRSRRGRGPGKIAERLAANALRRCEMVEVDVSSQVFTRGHADRLSASSAIWFKTRWRPQVPPTVSGFGSIAGGGHARVEVGEGHGMSEEFVQTRLFAPFRPLRKLAWALAPTRVFSMCRSSGASSPWTARSAKERWWGCCCH
jgi:hypothetical protein